MIEKKFLYPKLIFALILGFCLLYFQKATVLAESGPDLMIDNITTTDGNIFSVSVRLKNIGDVPVSWKTYFEIVDCELRGRDCSRDRTRIMTELKANGENSIGYPLSTGLRGCPPYGEGSFEASVCIYWKGVADVDTSNNCKTVTLNYEDLIPPCQIDQDCNLPFYTFCEDCYCHSSYTCSDPDGGKNIYQKGRIHYTQIGRSGNHYVEDHCERGGINVDSGGSLKEYFCYINKERPAAYEESDESAMRERCDGRTERYCHLSAQYVNCPSGYECSNGACREIGVEVTPTLTLPPMPPGDLDGGGDIDIFDLVIVSNSFGKSLGDPGYDPRADADGDGVVDILDLITVGSRFGETG